MKDIKSFLAHIGFRKLDMKHSVPGGSHPFDRLGGDDPDPDQRDGDSSLVEAAHLTRRECERLVSEGRVSEAAEAARRFVDQTFYEAVYTADAAVLLSIAGLTGRTE